MSLFQDLAGYAGRRMSIDQFLPLDMSHRAAKSHQRLRLFACACAERVLELLTDPAFREAVEAARNYALGLISWDALRFAWAVADSTKVPTHHRNAIHYATIAATACALTACYAGPRNQGQGPEWAAIAAARVASCAASLAEQMAWQRSVDEVEAAQLDLLRRYVPECFPE